MVLSMSKMRLEWSGMETPEFHVNDLIGELLKAPFLAACGNSVLLSGLDIQKRVTAAGLEFGPPPPPWGPGGGRE